MKTKKKLKYIVYAFVSYSLILFNTRGYASPLAEVINLISNTAFVCTAQHTAKSTKSVRNVYVKITRGG